MPCLTAAEPAGQISRTKPSVLKTINFLADVGLRRVLSPRTQRIDASLTRVLPPPSVTITGVEANCQLHAHYADGDQPDKSSRPNFIMIIKLCIQRSFESKPVGGGLALWVGLAPDRGRSLESQSPTTPRSRRARESRPLARAGPDSAREPRNPQRDPGAPTAAPGPSGDAAVREPRGRAPRVPRGVRPGSGLADARGGSPRGESPAEKFGDFPSFGGGPSPGNRHLIGSSPQTILTARVGRGLPSAHTFFAASRDPAEIAVIICNSPESSVSLPWTPPPRQTH